MRRSHAQRSEIRLARRQVEIKDDLRADNSPLLTLSYEFFGLKYYYKTIQQHSNHCISDFCYFIRKATQIIYMIRDSEFLSWVTRSSSARSPNCIIVWHFGVTQVLLFPHRKLLSLSTTTEIILRRG